MCTVSFLPTAAGFHLAMNRDEKRTRITALPPSIVRLNGHRAIFPREPRGGTWIAVNEAGLCLALINWHTIEREAAGEIVSRGQIVESLAGNLSARDIAVALKKLPLKNLRPFRLLVFDAARRVVVEWRWNLELLARLNHDWNAVHHWFSSGYDEPMAERQRTKICAAAQKRSSLGSRAALRRLHRSHAPEAGPFSICMHREDAATVSYTEVNVSARHARMNYIAGAPCCSAACISRCLLLGRH